MKNITPRQVALSVSLFVGLLSLLLLIVGNITLEQVNVYVLVFLPVALSFGAYFVVYYAMEKFIYHKIKIIYKTIYELKSNKLQGYGKKSINNDVLKDVEEEVDQWATGKRKEVEELRRMETFRREFLGNVSHELKTPLFNIIGYLETLKDGGIHDENINAQYIGKAIKNADRLDAIVQDLEFISKSENNVLNLTYSNFDLMALIEEVLSAAQMKADEAKISIGLKEGFDTKFIAYADRERISQVFLNLLVNSIRYGKEGGRTEISCYDMDENILVEVTDNGIGIDKVHLPRLFERFYRVDANRSRDVGGTGLGLSIVKHIMEIHNQTINVRSTLGIGSTFGFTLKKGQ